MCVRLLQSGPSFDSLLSYRMFFIHYTSQTFTLFNQQTLLVTVEWSGVCRSELQME